VAYPSNSSGPATPVEDRGAASAARQSLGRHRSADIARPTCGSGWSAGFGTLQRNPESRGRGEPITGLVADLQLTYTEFEPVAQVRGQVYFGGIRTVGVRL
jgi:hypothetical protein